MLGSFFRKPKSSPQVSLKLPEVDAEEHTEIANPHPLVAGQDLVSMQPPKQPVLTTENIALIGVLLLLVMGTLAGWGWMRYHALSKLRQAEQQQHELVLDSLQQVKTSLETNLDHLQTEFSELSTENDTLAHRLATTTNIVAQKEAAIQEIKSQNLREEKALREQVQRLQSIKDRYETIIAVLDQKNTVLERENARLRGANDSLYMEISDLGLKLEAQIRQTLSAKYKASAFRLDLVRRNDKPTIRAKRTRELRVSFELNRVPEMYQGNQRFYLVITDDRGIPISSPNAMEASINSERGNVQILAQSTQMQNVIDNQHVEMIYKLEDRLKKGTYLVSVYSEKGLLGVASFRLT